MAFYGLSLIFLIPAGVIIAALIFFYLIYNRIRERKSEDFEKRSN